MSHADPFGQAPKTYKPPKITGYRTLTDAEIAIINRKAKAEEVRDLLEWIKGEALVDRCGLDHRWLAVGQTDLQKGFMAVIRAVARPETF